jgi:hypothetical protein
MINTTTIRARVLRLRDLAHGLGKEIALWQAQEGPLLPIERKKYLEAVYDVNASTDEAAVVLEAALVRLEKLARFDTSPELT